MLMVIGGEFVGARQGGSWSRDFFPLLHFYLGFEGEFMGDWGRLGGKRAASGSGAVGGVMGGGFGVVRVSRAASLRGRWKGKWGGWGESGVVVGFEVKLCSSEEYH